ncbi:hypothetical protein FXV83_25740 [Bradyrhizobium hipponense]|uniref:Uncharacterized protein n=1 Tax=Bradyrhizobium hipponense TaxID=2605638 RepID=A0A5S4YH48_9BRAD|nr:hypothetical protein [Bradyrhizobium hipponense]TYO63726.1 hypothetical protein FXV83_25740 [Bradyrhizobium hipponense]
MTSIELGQATDAMFLEFAACGEHVANVGAPDRCRHTVLLTYGARMSESSKPEDENENTSAQQSIPASLVLSSEHRETLQKMQSEWVSLVKQFSEGYRVFAEALMPRAFELREQMNAFSRHIAPFLAQLKEVAEKAPPAYRKALLLLGENGWYMDLDMSLAAPLDLGRALKKGDIEHAENALVTYFEARVDQIERFLVEAHPRRAKVLTSAFAAHKAGQFDLSIPVLLAQTDGICRDEAGQYLFTGPRGRERDKRYKGKPGIAVYADEVASDTFLSVVLSPLGEKLPINASESERADGWIALNRHMVLHGESVDYGTKINSLKAISLINYVASSLKLIKRGAT